MAEIRTCEEYVIRELELAQIRVDNLRDELTETNIELQKTKRDNERLKNEIQGYKLALDVLNRLYEEKAKSKFIEDVNPKQQTIYDFMEQGEEDGTKGNKEQESK